jgi:hypothetical protein
MIKIQLQELILIAEQSLATFDLISHTWFFYRTFGSDAGIMCDLPLAACATTDAQK